MLGMCAQTHLTRHEDEQQVCGVGEAAAHCLSCLDSHLYHSSPEVSAHTVESTVVARRSLSGLSVSQECFPWGQMCWMQAK